MKALSRAGGAFVAVVLFLLFLVPGSSAQQGYQIVDAFGELEFTDPIGIITAPDDPRVFVLERAGVIAVVTNLAIPTRTEFMDISARVGSGLNNSEEGLLGLAFHPGYKTNRTFFAFYTTTSPRRDRLSRFQISPSNPHQGLANSEVILIDQPDDAVNHNGGDLHFGDDGYLYVSLGDEGGADDILNNSQRIDKDFFSGMLRIDVDMKEGNLTPNEHPASRGNYLVPEDNPFVGATSFNGLPVAAANVRTEFWAVGLRNPWRFSFDRVTGILYVGDVGQLQREEIDIIVKGGNYGWNYREGLIARPGSGAPPAGFTSIDPIQDYPRSGDATEIGRSVTGGVVYRGAAIPDLYGHYVFADFVSGNVWALHYDGTNSTPYRHLVTHPSITAFGVDPINGDVLLANLAQDRIKRLVFVEPSALAVEIVPAGSVWRYLDDGSDQGTQWRELGFDDSSWALGAAELGNGDGDEVTLINLGPSNARYRALYFRHTWNVPDLSVYSSLNVGFLRDDGGVVYLNGAEVFRSNMPEGTITYLTFASTGTPEETTFFEMPVDLGLLREGVNVLAAEVHQSSSTSSDVSFDLKLTGEVLPELEVEGGGDMVRVSWPAPAPGYALQGTPTLAPEIWRVETSPSERNGARNSVDISMGGPNRYFRLARIDPLSVVSLPQSATVNVGEDVVFSVTAVGNAPLSYQWSLNGEEIEGATGSSLELTGAQLTDAGAYTVVVEDSAGQTATVGATLVVLAAPVIVVQPQDQTVNVGDDVTFSVTATGTLPMGYRWRRGGVAILIEPDSQLLTSSVTLSNVSADLNGSLITVVLTNAASFTPGVISRRAVLTVNP